MIIAKDDSWAICTPPKTGTVSLQTALVPNFANTLQYRHQSSYTGKGERILVVRNPLERWASMYWFTKQKARTAIFLGAYTLNVDMYAHQFFIRRELDPHPFFTDNQVEFHKKFEADIYFKQEDGLQKIMSYIGLGYVQVPHENQTKSKVGWQQTSKLLNKENYNKVMEWADKDLFKFKYT